MHASKVKSGNFQHLRYISYSDLTSFCGVVTDRNFITRLLYENTCK